MLHVFWKSLAKFSAGWENAHTGCFRQQHEHVLWCRVEDLCHRDQVVPYKHKAVIHSHKQVNPGALFIWALLVYQNPQDNRNIALVSPWGQMFHLYRRLSSPDIKVIEHIAHSCFPLSHLSFLCFIYLIKARLIQGAMCWV